MFKTKSLLIRIGIICAAIFILLNVLSAACFFAGFIDIIFTKPVVTTDLDDYGKYTGNYDNDFPNEFITSFFPEKIEDNFSNVKYSYRARKGDTYAFEAYLEFQIDDPSEFQSFVENYAGGYSPDFHYDPSFKEYTIADIFEPTSLSNESNSNETNCSIRYAKIGKILYSEETHTIIFVAIGVYDGGVVNTDFLCEYFNRFGIDPREYSNTRGRF